MGCRVCGAEISRPDQQFCERCGARFPPPEASAGGEGPGTPLDDASRSGATDSVTPTTPPAAAGSEQRAQGVRRAWIGGLVFGVALIITLATYSSAESDAQQSGSGTYVVLWGPMLFGAVFCIMGIVQQLQAKKTEQAGWKPDPLHRHQHRYWDGSSWTNHVATNGKQEVDAINGAGLGGTSGADPGVPCELCGKHLDQKDPVDQHMAEVHGLSPGD